MLIPAYKSAAALALLCLMFTDMALAKPLTRENCSSMRVERLMLEKQGVSGYIEKGAEWARGNLDDEQLALVGKYMRLEAGIRFRCGIAPINPRLANKTPRYRVPLPVRNSLRVLQKKKAALGNKQVPTAHKLETKSAKATAVQPVEQQKTPATKTAPSSPVEPDKSSKASKPAVRKPKPALKKVVKASKLKRKLKRRKPVRRKKEKKPQWKDSFFDRY